MQNPSAGNDVTAAATDDGDANEDADDNVDADDDDDADDRNDDDDDDRDDDDDDDRDDDDDDDDDRDADDDDDLDGAPGDDIGADPADPTDPTLEEVTFTNEVRPILVANCGRCHAAGNLPNFASANADTGYAVASRESREIIEQISEGSMPADTCRGGAPGDAGCVSVADFETLRAWVAADTPE